ncbi:hypothetical protein [Cupriavidus taiwanensis]|uniref:hypothetical protein n=1 Tax=Cupriavidus taiwanensis TaxID=164546 RepID=UPI000E102D3A|nr:hypothetical protein [Cupriavidus taiwanensis]SPA50632.1 protein of unknown function [Cupriavidus taiwanensis]
MPSKPRPVRVALNVQGEDNAQAIFDVLAAQDRKVGMGRKRATWWFVAFNLRPGETPGEMLAHIRSLFPRARIGLQDVFISR